MKVILTKKNKVVDITELTTKKSWGGDIKSAPRFFKTTVIRDEEIEISRGDQISLLDTELKSLFTGYIFSKTTDKYGNISIKCYDELFYLANNSDVFNFNNKTLGEIMTDICKRFEIKFKIIDDSTYKVPSLPLKEMSLWEYFQKAKKSTFDTTGDRFILRLNNDKIELVKRRNQVQEWIIENGNNLIDFNYTESNEKLKTKIKLVHYTKGKKIIALAESNELIEQFGILQEYKNITEKTNQAALNIKANQMLKEKSRAKERFLVECLGVDDIKAGDAIFVNIPILNVKKAYYIESDKHYYFNNKNTMKLELINALDLEGSV